MAEEENVRVKICSIVGILTIEGGGELVLFFGFALTVLHFCHVDPPMISCFFGVHVVFFLYLFIYYIFNELIS